ncbi:hypothetical protein B0H12DRAFT_95014 [Mycena haematopus]|nr:hypothetical protein B0H12DRAFT_95014 [Mycena haematopus]
MPWAQLTDLNLVANYADIGLDVLGQCTNLITAVVNTAGWDVLPEAGQGILTLSHLNCFFVGFFGPAKHFIPFFDRLSTPALENLCLDFGRIHDADVAWTQARFTAFQLRAPDITQLDLRSFSLTSDALKTAIRHAPSLTHLKLSRCPLCFDDALIDALSYKAGVSPLAPHLRNLRLRYIGDNFTKNNLAGMITSRWWTDTELASHSIPPNVARWTRVVLCGDFADDVIDIVKNLSSDIPISECC